MQTVWVVFIWIGFAIAVGAMAGNRGRNGFGWFLLALIISPLLASIFLLISPDLHAQKLIVDEILNSKKCPFCAELIKLEASVCRYCGRDVADAPTIIDAEPPSHSGRNSQSNPFATSVSLIERNAPAKTVQRPNYGILSGDDAYRFNIVGESHYQESLEEIVGGRSEEGAEFYCAALLLREPSNPHDRNAIRVVISRKTVGYLGRADAVHFDQALSLGSYDGAACAAVVVGGWDRDGDQGFFGVKLNAKLPFVITDPPTSPRAAVDVDERVHVVSNEVAVIKSAPLPLGLRLLAKAAVFLLVAFAVAAAIYLQPKATESSVSTDKSSAPPPPAPTQTTPIVTTPPKAETTPVPRARPAARKEPDAPLNIAPPK